MWTSLFWKDLAERMVATVAQVLLGILTASGFNVVSFDLVGTLTVVGVAAAVVVLKALIAANVSGTVSPASLAKDDRGF
jgi:hypothetical protein